MADRLEIFREAETRGLLNPRQQAILDEARKRDLLTPAPYAPIPEPVTPELAPPAPPQPEGGKAEAIMAGGMAGAELGMAAGAPGALAGGVLGVGAGYFAHESIVRGLKEMGVLPPETTIKTDKEMFQDAFDEMSLEAAFGGAALKIGDIARHSRTAWQKFLATNEGRALSQKAKELGVGLGIIDITNSRILQAYPKVVGIFPFIGTPFREAQTRKAGEVLGSRDRLLYRLGPSVGLAELGINLKQASKNTFRAFRDEANRLYEKALILAKQRNAVVPLDGTKKTLGETIEEMTARLPKDAEGVVIGGKKNPALEFAERYANVGDSLTIQEYDGLLEELDVALKESRDSGFNVKPLMEIKKALEVDLKNIPDQEVAAAFRQADDYFARMMKTFETPTAQKVRRIEKKPFSVGLSKPGTLNADELFKPIWNQRSPQAMRDLRKLVGNKQFNTAVRGHLENVWQQAVDASGPNGVFHPGVFASRLGLNNPRSLEYASLREALDGTSLRIETLKDFVDSVDAAFKEGVPDPKTFVARRATLGGAKSALRALLPAGAITAGGAAAGGVSGAAGAVTASYLAFMGSKALAKSREMQLVIDILDEARPPGMRINAMTRLVRLAPEAYEEEPPTVPQSP